MDFGLGQFWAFLRVVRERRGRGEGQGLGMGEGRAREGGGSHHQIRSFSLSLCVFSLNFGGVLVGQDLKCDCFRLRVVVWNPGGLQAARSTARSRPVCVSRFWVCSKLYVYVCVCVVFCAFSPLYAGPPSPEPPSAGPLRADSPPPDPPPPDRQKFRAFFFPLPPPISFFFSLTVCLLVEFWWFL